jgi:hypothetical protein
MTALARLLVLAASAGAAAASAGAAAASAGAAAASAGAAAASAGANAAAAGGNICGVVRASNLVSLVAFDNTTGKVQVSVPLVGLAQGWSAGLTAGAVDAGTTMYYVHNASSTLLGTASLSAQMSYVVTVRPPTGYAGSFAVVALNIDVNASHAPVALLVGGGGSGGGAGWAVLADVDPSTGAATARTNLTGAYFGSGYAAYKPGLSALDPYGSTLWLVAPGSDGDVAVGFDVSGPSAAPQPTAVPFPEGSTVTSLRFAGPFFSGPGLLATVVNPPSGAAAVAGSSGSGAAATATATAASTVSLLGSFLDQAGGADFFEVQNYDTRLRAAGPGQLALGPREVLSYVGLQQQGGASVVSVVNTQTNAELARVTPQGFEVLGLVACTGGGPSGE